MVNDVTSVGGIRHLPERERVGKMALHLARSECREGFWHVVTYDISDPDNWIEVSDIKTSQECKPADCKDNSHPATVALLLGNEEHIRHLSRLYPGKASERQTQKR